MEELIKEALKKAISERASKLLEEDLSEGKGGKYFIGYDKDWVDNGVGMECIRCDTIQDEGEAWEDAKQELVEEMNNADYETFYSLIDDENVCNAITKLLEGC